MINKLKKSLTHFFSFPRSLQLHKFYSVIHKSSTKMFRLKIFLFLIFLNFSLSQIPQQAELDAKLSSANQDLINGELRIAKVLSDYHIIIFNSSASLSSTKSLKTSLDNLANVVEQQMTINNFSPYVNISTCGDINYKITMLDFDQQKFHSILNEVNTNVTAIYGKF